MLSPTRILGPFWHTTHHLTSSHITSHHVTSRHATSHHVTSRHLTSPHLTSPHLTSRHLTSPHLTSPHLTSPHLTSPHLTSPHLTSPHLTSPHLTSPHLTSPHLTSPHLTSPHLTSPIVSYRIVSYRIVSYHVICHIMSQQSSDILARTPHNVALGDHRGTAEYIPVNEEQTNNRGEMRAALRSLQGHQIDHRSLICPDSMLVVNGLLGWAQSWRRHKWHNTSGPVKHVDLWTQILDLVEWLGDEIALPHRHQRKWEGGSLGKHGAETVSAAVWTHLNPP